MATATKLTRDLLDIMQKYFLFAETHVHFPGLFTPQIMIALGIENGWIDANGTPLKAFESFGREKKGQGIFPHYAHLLAAGPDGNGPIIIDGIIASDIRFRMQRGEFDSFDAVYAFTHSHRHGEGAIMNEKNVQTVLRSYLSDCRKLGIRHSEVQINISDLAGHIYRNEPGAKEEKINKLCRVLEKSVKEFAQPIGLSKTGVNLCFLHCFNKTTASGIDRSLAERAIEAAEMVVRLNKSFPFIVGLQTAGNESMYQVSELKDAYAMVRAAGLVAGAHAGEGQGGQHVFEVLSTLTMPDGASSLSSGGHFFRSIELLKALGLLEEYGLVLNQCPLVNDHLGSILRINDEGQPDVHGTEKRKIGHVYNHPFFELLRTYKARVNLCSDNPGFFGSLEDEILAMAGISVKFPSNKMPLTFEELCITNLNGVMASAMPEKQKIEYAKDLVDFIGAQNFIRRNGQTPERPIDIGSHPLLEKLGPKRFAGGDKIGLVTRN